jgi:rubrerythrin
MNTLQTAAHLASLMHMDLDAVQVYDEALEHVTEDDVREHFEGFRDEHDYHATVLAAEIRRLGHTPPEPREDFAGHFAEMVTALRSVSGTSGAIGAMRTAERYHNRRYRQAQSLDVDAELKEVLARFFDDEQRHLEYCEKKLAAHAAH